MAARFRDFQQTVVLRSWLLVASEIGVCWRWLERPPVDKCGRKLIDFVSTILATLWWFSLLLFCLPELTGLDAGFRCEQSRESAHVK